MFDGRNGPADPAAEHPLHILLQIIQFPPDVNSTGLLMEQVAQGLADRGHRLSVLTTFPHYERFRIWDEYRGKLVQRDLHGALEVLRLWVYASGTKQRMAHRLLSYLSFNALATTARLAAPGAYDVVLCTNGSFFSGLSAWVGGLFGRTPFVYNVQDLYPEAPVAAGQLTDRRQIALLAHLEQWMYRTAAHVTVIAPSFRQNLLKKGVPSEKVSVIPNFVDTDFIRPLPKRNPWSQRHGLADRFVVSHAGNVGYVYDLETLLQAAALLRERPEIVFLIVGDGVARPALERQAEALRLDNVRFLPFQPREELPWLRAASDLQVSLYRPESSRYSMPSKVYEIMASGRPLLASAEPSSDLRQLVESSGCGVCLPPREPALLTETVLRLAGDPAARSAMAERGRAVACARYSRQAIVEQYDQLLRQVADRSRPRDQAKRSSVRMKFP